MARATPHARDLADLAILRDAVAFNAAVFLGRGQYDRTEGLPDLTRAREAAKTLEAKHHPRRALIYGVNAAGQSALVTPELETLMQDQDNLIGSTYASRAVALRGIKRAGEKPENFTITKGEDGRWAIGAAAKGKAQAAAVAPAPRQTQAIPPAIKANGAAGAVKLKTTAPKPKAPAKKAAPAPAPVAQAAPPVKAKAKAKKKAAPKQAQTHAGRHPALEGPTHAEALALARATGKLPAFGPVVAEPFRALAAAVVELAACGQEEALRALNLEPRPLGAGGSSRESLVALANYRDLCVAALESRY